MSIRTKARNAFTEHFADILDETGELIEDAELPTYWQDDISELADGLVPIYTKDRVQEWLNDNCPEIDDPGLVEGVTDVITIIGVVLYERYTQELYELAEGAGFNN